ncbi:Os11g0216100, partial [Oryza sativa Japonica Group]
TKTKALDSTRAPPRARTHAHSGLARMAASTASAPFTPLLHRRRASVHGRRGSGRAFVAVVVAAAAGGAPETEPSPATAAGAAAQGKKKTVDTRIHWSDPDEGWVGGNAKKDGGGRKKEPLGGRFADLINNPSESHYQFLGVEPKADIEEIKAAYRRLSKEYHPDTTSLPLREASERFIRLREAYNVLSREESRRFYDWTLAQEAESRRLQQLRSRLEDPYQQDLDSYQSVPDMVDRLGGRNMDLSDQAMTALTIDIGIIIFCVFCLIYAVFFKEQY